MIQATSGILAAFNLICSGTTYLGSGVSSLKKTNQIPFETTYRIDLQSGRWCAGDCKRTSEIAAVERTRIFLKQDRDDKAGTASVTVVNREDGSLTDQFDGGGELRVTTIGKCIRAPFSGFPSLKF